MDLGAQHHRFGWVMLTGGHMWVKGKLQLPYPLHPPSGALLWWCLKLYSREAEVKAVPVLQTEPRAFLLHPRVWMDIRSQTQAVKSPVYKQSAILILSPPQLAVVGKFSSQPCVQGAPKWDLP